MKTQSKKTQIENSLMKFFQEEKNNNSEYFKPEDIKYSFDGGNYNFKLPSYYGSLAYEDKVAMEWLKKNMIVGSNGEFGRPIKEARPSKIIIKLKK